MAYCEREDVEMIFGAVNVAKWADLDNDSDEDTISERIEWACDRGTSYIDVGLTGSVYTPPFDSPHAEIVDAAARIAGVELYRCRGIHDVDADGQPIDHVRPHKEMVDALITALRKGKKALPGASRSQTYPNVVEE